MTESKKCLPQLIIALDNCSPDEAKVLVKEVSSAGVRWFKVGLELYTQAGPDFVKYLKDHGFFVFLDLKLYDIPNTVAKAVNAAAKTGADLLTIHASGGQDMLRAAQNETQGTLLSIIGVTVLTSFGGESFQKICETWGASQGGTVLREFVALGLAKLAAEASLSGIVCAVSDLQGGSLKKIQWKREQPFFVTPGIRDQGDSAQDQKSIATVAQAVTAGSSHLVVGRPITAPANGSRAEAAAKFLRQIESSYGS
jgi:orotidine-5'-phosphate decarboxylase